MNHPQVPSPSKMLSPSQSPLSLLFWKSKHYNSSKITMLLSIDFGRSRVQVFLLSVYYHWFKYFLRWQFTEFSKPLRRKSFYDIDELMLGFLRFKILYRVLKVDWEQLTSNSFSTRRPLGPKRGSGAGIACCVNAKRHPDILEFSQLTVSIPKHPDIPKSKLVNL